MSHYIATFASHYDALVFKKRLDALGLSAALRPVPRQLSSSCGTCVRFEADACPPPPYPAETERIVREEAGDFIPEYIAKD